jgi:Domain of unknown function (DUF1883)
MYAEPKFLHYEVRAGTGDAVEVSLNGNAANVLLLDDANYRNYQSGKAFHYQVGGYFSRSPVVLQAPSSGNWHLIVDLGGRPGRVSASVRVLSRA